MFPSTNLLVRISFLWIKISILFDHTYNKRQSYNDSDNLWFLLDASSESRWRGRSNRWFGIKKTELSKYLVLKKWFIRTIPCYELLYPSKQAFIFRVYTHLWESNFLHLNGHVVESFCSNHSSIYSSDSQQYTRDHYSNNRCSTQGPFKINKNLLK